MLRAIIIDDEYNGVRSLELLIQKFIQDVKVVASSTNPVEGIELINDYRPEIVFLDINMPVLNGFQLLDNIEYKDFHLIFTTAYQEHGLQAIKRNALDYLLKPVSIDELRTAIARIKKKVEEAKQPADLKELFDTLRSMQQQRVAFPTRTSIELVPSSDIMYLEAQSNNCIVVLTNGVQHQVLKSLKDYEEILCKPGSNFFRLHNSFIVNIDYAGRYVREDGGSIIMSNKKEIPVSKTKKNDLMVLLRKFQME